MALSNNRSHRIITFCALYFAQGIPWGFMLLTLPSYLLDNFGEHYGDDEIGGLKAIILIPWSFKLIWAPIMDSFTIRSMGRRRSWIIGAELLMALTLLGLIGLGDLSDQLTPLLYMYFLHNCFASLQDVCTDAMAVDLLPDDEQGQMNGMMWGSKLVGKAGGAWALSYVINWGGIEACVWVQVALLAVIMIVPLLFLERPGERRLPWSAGSAQGDNTSSVRSPFEAIEETFKALTLPTLAVFIVFTLVKLLGTGINEVVVNTLYIKQLGWSDLDFTTASGLYTLPLLILGTLLGGMVADRFGRRLILIVGYGGFAVVAIVFSLCPQFWDQYWFALTYLLAFETLAAIGSVGFLSMAMRISWSTAAATVFTVYMTLSNVSHVVGNWLAGPVRRITTEYAESSGLVGSEAELMSYQLTIGLAGLITLPALLLLLRVRTSEVDEAGRQPQERLEAVNSEGRVGFGKRFLAVIIDLIVILVGGSICGIVLGGLLGGVVGAGAGTASGEAGATELGGLFGGIIGAFVGVSLGVFVVGNVIAVWEASSGGGFGKRALGIKVKSADGSPASFAKRLYRTLFKYNVWALGLVASLTGIDVVTSASGVGCCVVAIGCLLALGRKKQALHDRLFGTAVFLRDVSSDREISEKNETDAPSGYQDGQMDPIE